MTDRLMLLDSASLYFRAFFGVPSVSAPDGTPVNAVRGFLDIIAKLVSTYDPGSVVACWDDDWRPAWRVALIPTYKAHRVTETVPGGRDVEEVPDALTAQVPLIRETLAVLGIPIAGASGYEADDVIGTLTARAGGPVDVVTGDRDLFQLVDDDRGVRVVYTARGMSNLEVVTDDVIVGKYGVHAAQYADFATLRGDASDGLPGVSGVGEKSAATLLQTHGTLDGVRAAAHAGTGMTARISTRIVDAAPYLEVAPEVVQVAREAPVDAAPGPLGPVTDEQRRAAEEFATTWGLSAPMARALNALAAAAR
ncbi:5'-3' exonuclease [Microbacterium sp.]|uniref:5'-3' exonuclease n=1 Tax=Microbacterium sp. TaxID=51671 RepID=UPI003A90C367